MDGLFETLEEALNPLDCVEEVLNAHNWVFSRMDDEYLNVEVAGKSCSYFLQFIWREDINALQLQCHYDLKIPAKAKKLYPDQIMRAVMSANNSLNMGHFEITQDGAPCFKYTSLLRGSGASGFEYMEDVLDIALSQCEQFQPLFDILAAGKAPDERDICLALLDTSGTA